MAGRAICFVKLRPSGEEIFFQKIFGDVRLLEIAAELASLFHTRELSGSEAAFVSLVNDSPYTPLFGVSNVERAIRSFRESHRSEFGIANVHDGVDACESIGENFVSVTEPSVFKGDESNTVSGLWIGAAVRRAVEGNKRTVAIALRELIPAIE